MKHLKETDIKQLKEWGYSLQDIMQIDDVIDYTVFETSRHKKIDDVTARRVLGTYAFLSGLSRAAFHWSAERDCANGKGTVSFDCGAYFK